MNPVALWQVLNCAATALCSAEDGLTGIAGQAYLEASFAAGDAFPLDSRESEALGLILAAVGGMVTGRTP